MVKQSTPRREEPVDLGILLGLAFAGFAERLDAHLKDRGFDDIGRWYGYVFRLLAASSPSLSELAAHLGITAQGAMKIVDEMEARGYVERVPSPDDARVKHLHLAPRGKKALGTARSFHRTFERDLGAKKAAQLRAVLEAIAGEEAMAAPLLRPM